MITISDLATEYKRQINSEYRRMLDSMIKLFSNGDTNMLAKIEKEKYQNALMWLGGQELEISSLHEHHSVMVHVGKMMSELVDSIHQHQTKLVEKANLDIAFCRYINSDASPYLDDKLSCNNKLPAVTSALLNIRYALDNFKNDHDCLPLLNSINACLDVVFKNEEIARSYM